MSAVARSNYTKLRYRCTSCRVVMNGDDARWFADNTYCKPCLGDLDEVPNAASDAPMIEARAIEYPGAICSFDPFAAVVELTTRTRFGTVTEHLCRDCFEGRKAEGR